MTLTELRYIVAVARERHFGKAAAACFVSQPTLSVAIKKLEDQLGVTIFERHQHEIHITPTGEKIIEQAHHVLEEADKIKLIVQEQENELSGQIRLGVIYTVGPYLLPKLIPMINKMAPDITLIIEEDFTSHLADKLKQGELDMVIASTPFDLPAVETQLLYKEPFMIALPKGHRLSKKKTLKIEDLLDDTLLLLKAGNCFRDQVVDACDTCMQGQFSKKKIQQTLEGSSIETIRQMVATGAGITILPCTSVEEGPSIKGQLDFKPFTNPAPERDVIIAYRKSYPRIKTVELMMKAISEAKLTCVNRS